MFDEPGMGLAEFIALNRPQWMNDPKRHCRTHDMDAFFDGTARAIAICQDCPQQSPCLQYALDNNERGVWGGTSERQRKKIRRMKK